MVKARFTKYNAEAAYAFLATPCITNRAGVQPRPQLKPALTDFDMQQYICM